MSEPQVVTAENEALRMARAQVYATCLLAATIDSGLKHGSSQTLPEIAAKFYAAAMQCTETKL